MSSEIMYLQKVFVLKKHSKNIKNNKMFKLEFKEIIIKLHSFVQVIGIDVSLMSVPANLMLIFIIWYSRPERKNLL